ncbi:uncharacterized protein F4812DRAFT_456896 [Daldinia caldariorum]|uniref:uncharacterized protein n=1 Tax=Daldinia caldariorum TaxID=326644 RepID=UPI002007C110|nr:uncharacterized protein F4812DRAFT_456896 [Daldinia caldariorum]KAI1470886.1 hypothetical protein F4812DRAFT_456896 [Daldinia caldariorum]
MGGQFSPFDPLRCPHYAQFASRLDRTHFDGIYWTLFFLVICILFVSSWVYQSYVNTTTTITAITWCTLLFSLAAVFLVIEVFALLALQFCDGEDLMALYWATWTMLQLGSEIAILGVVLALWHHLSNVRLPLWALALGTPVLVVAGFGHVIQIALRMVFKRARARRRTRRDAEAGGGAGAGEVEEEEEEEKREDVDTLSPTTHKPDQDQSDDDDLENGLCLYLAMDVGDDERVRKWPCFVGLADGKSIVRLTAYTGSLPSPG